MPLEPLKALTTALLSMIPEDSSPRVMVVKPEVPAPTPVRPNGTKAPSSSQPLYDPTFVCLMELSTVFAIRDEETVAEVGKEVAEVLQLAIRNADRLHPVSVSRASFYLLKLLKASNVSFLFGHQPRFILTHCRTSTFSAHQSSSTPFPPSNPTCLNNAPSLC